MQARKRTAIACLHEDTIWVKVRGWAEPAWTYETKQMNQCKQINGSAMHVMRASEGPIPQKACMGSQTHKNTPNDITTAAIPKFSKGIHLFLHTSPG